MIAVYCCECGNELQEPGALVFGPHDGDGLRPKKHVCLGCWPKVEALCTPVRTYMITPEMVVGPPDAEGNIQEYRK